MSRLRRGQVWELADARGSLGAVLVLSGNAYNELPGPTVLVVRLIEAAQADPAAMTVRLTGEHAAVLDWVTYARKTLFQNLLTEVDTTDVNNLLFKMIATN